MLYISTKFRLCSSWFKEPENANARWSRDLQLNLWTLQDSGHSVLVQFNHTQSREILEHGISVTKRGFGFSTRKTVGGSLQQPVAQKL